MNTWWIYNGVKNHGSQNKDSKSNFPMTTALQNCEEPTDFAVECLAWPTTGAHSGWRLVVWRKAWHCYRHLQACCSPHEIRWRLWLGYCHLYGVHGCFGHWLSQEKSVYSRLMDHSCIRAKCWIPPRKDDLWRATDLVGPIRAQRWDGECWTDWCS